MSYFNHFKKEVPGLDGYAHLYQKEPNGVEYHTLLDVIHSEFDFCGCGDPKSAIEYVYRAMDWISRMRQHLEKQDQITLSDPVYDALWKEEQNRFGSVGAMYFMWYWLDNQKLTEHGGSVPGWLTEKGKGILIDMKEALEL